MVHQLQKKPNWLRAKLPIGKRYKEIRSIVDSNILNTVCQSAQCPNMGECWSRGTATIMILGNICTRSCRFCAVKTGRPKTIDLGEPVRVGNAVAKMKLKHAVITSVARDDLKDGGASIWAATIKAIRYSAPKTAIEVLIPDFKGYLNNLDIIIEAKPDIFNHNIETVNRLQRSIRKTGRYKRSLSVLKYIKEKNFITKSGIMLGLGELKDEISQTMHDLREINVNILTIGQYLQPSKNHAPINRWVTPEEFKKWKSFGISIGFDFIESGPLVRSSYHAEEQSKLYKLL